MSTNPPQQSDSQPQQSTNPPQQFDSQPQQPTTNPPQQSTGSTQLPRNPLQQLGELLDELIPLDKDLMYTMDRFGPSQKDAERTKRLGEELLRRLHFPKPEDEEIK